MADLVRWDGEDPRCCMPIVEWQWDDDSHGDLLEEFRPQPPYECGEELYVVWSFSCPIAKGDPIVESEVPQWSVASSWELTCRNGHTLASSGNQYTATDSAERFDPTVVLASLGIGGPGQDGGEGGSGGS